MSGKTRGQSQINGYCREKLMKLDAKRREYDIIVIGEEPHLAYNRVGLTSFFQHRKVENLYLNPKNGYFSPLSLNGRFDLIICSTRIAHQDL